MNIRPSAAICQNYNEIADLCRETAENIKLREELLSVEEDRLAGRMGCTLNELDGYLDNVIAEVSYGS